MEGAQVTAKTILPRGGQVLVSAVFIAAGSIKLFDPTGFASDIANYHVVPWPVGVSVAFYLPWLEILCGVVLLVGAFKGGSVIILTCLTIVFIVATLSAKLRGIDISCGCFGHASHNWTFSAHLAVDLILLALLLLLLRHEWQSRLAQRRLRA